MSTVHGMSYLTTKVGTQICDELFYRLNRTYQIENIINKLDIST